MFGHASTILVRRQASVSFEGHRQQRYRGLDSKSRLRVVDIDKVPPGIVVVVVVIVVHLSKPAVAETRTVDADSRRCVVTCDKEAVTAVVVERASVDSVETGSDGLRRSDWIEVIHLTDARRYLKHHHRLFIYLYMSKHNK